MRGTPEQFAAAHAYEMFPGSLVLRLFRHWNIGGIEDVVKGSCLGSDVEVASVGVGRVVVKPTALEADKKIEDLFAVSSPYRMTGAEATDNLAARPATETLLKGVRKQLALLRGSNGGLAEDDPTLERGNGG